MSNMNKIEFKFINLLDADSKVREFKHRFENCRVIVKIRQADHDRLIDTGLLGDMSLDDVLNCEMRVV